MQRPAREPLSVLPAVSSEYNAYAKHRITDLDTYFEVQSHPALAYVRSCLFPAPSADHPSTPPTPLHPHHSQGPIAWLLRISSNIHLLKLNACIFLANEPYNLTTCRYRLCCRTYFDMSQESLTHPERSNLAATRKFSVDKRHTRTHSENHECES